MILNYVRIRTLCSIDLNGHKRLRSSSIKHTQVNFNHIRVAKGEIIDGS